MRKLLDQLPALVAAFYPVLRPALSLFYTDSFLLALIARRRNQLLVIAPMKTGSTWLSVLLETLTGWKTALAAPAYCQREQELDLRCMVTRNAQQDALFSHLHLRYSEYTEKVLLTSGMRCVLMTRNLFDTVVSLVDHCDNPSLRMPMFFMTEADWRGLTREEKIERIVDLVVPWYFNFYAGWFTHRHRFGDRMLLVRYEDLCADPVAELERIRSAFGIEVAMTAEEAVRRAEDASTLKNFGFSGRGKELSPAVVQHIERLASYYPSVDFSSIGIPHDPPGN